MEVRFYATLRQITGCRSVTLPLAGGATVRRLIDAVLERYPVMREDLLDEKGELLGHVHVFINGRDAPYLDKGLETVLAAEDTVDVFPAVAGG
ncbi:MAG: ubiquitin-like small modifier protein 1 [Planctomycetota bacterium]|jgi:molybdopterin synthase sulfur carrier subunit